MLGTKALQSRKATALEWWWHLIIHAKMNTVRSYINSTQ